MGLWQRSIDEIGSDRGLRIVGACVALTYALSALHWLSTEMVPALSGPEAACWPGLGFCRSIRWLGEGGLTVYLYGLLALSLASAALMARPRTVKWALATLLVCVALKAYFMSLDYRTRLNQHYMAFLATAVFVLIPHKRDALRLLILLFYVWAATLKLNYEWLSGAALYDRLWLFPPSWVPALCAYVVVLELVLVWGLLSTRPVIFWGALSQLGIFHLLSFELVGFFYPSLMALLLVVFVVGYRAERRGGASLLSRLIRFQVPRPALAVALFTSLLQLTPHLYPGDPAITGEGRLFGLHMFDARVSCTGGARVHSADGGSAFIQPDSRFRRSTRMACDPNIYIEFARNLCGRQLRGLGRVAELDLRLRSRKVTDTRWRRIIEHRDFCSRPLSFHALLPNHWMVER